MPGLSIHVVDVAQGEPATGMRVQIIHGGVTIGDGYLTGAGTLDHPITEQTLAAGPYEVLFHAGAYFAGRHGDSPFLDVVPFRFKIADPARHYHLPLKITLWGFSLFRGA